MRNVIPLILAVSAILAFLAVVGFILAPSSVFSQIFSFLIVGIILVGAAMIFSAGKKKPGKQQSSVTPEPQPGSPTIVPPGPPATSPAEMMKSASPSPTKAEITAKSD
jgi:hypothetical protein